MMMLHFFVALIAQGIKLSTLIIIAISDFAANLVDPFVRIGIGLYTIIRCGHIDIHMAHKIDKAWDHGVMSWLDFLDEEISFWDKRYKLHLKLTCIKMAKKFPKR